MKIIISLLFTVLCAFQIAVSQNNPYFESYDWEESPSYAAEEGSTEDMIAVKE